MSCSASKKILSNIDDYDEYISEVNGAETFMPLISEIGLYESIHVYFYTVDFVFVSQSLNLIVTYNENDYLEIKNGMDAKYKFIKEPIIIGKDTYIIPTVDTTVNGFYIRVVEDESFIYPKKFGMIGVSDSTFQVCYMFYYDWDYDVISNMSDFVNNNFIFSNN